jgi:hypothetical protein
MLHEAARAERTTPFASVVRDKLLIASSQG